MSEEILQKSEYLSWRNDPTTQKVFELLKEEQDNIKEELASGLFLHDKNGLVTSAKQIGIIEGINKVLLKWEIEEDGE